MDTRAAEELEPRAVILYVVPRKRDHVSRRPKTWIPASGNDDLHDMSDLFGACPTRLCAAKARRLVHPHKYLIRHSAVCHCLEFERLVCRALQSSR